MPERGPRIARWIWLGRALPKRTRERVFEPAFHDLLNRALRSEQRNVVRFATQAIGVFAGAFALNLGALLLSRRALAATALLLLLLTVAFMLQSWLGHLYATG